MKSYGLSCLLVISFALNVFAGINRAIPKPHQDHPGNIYLAGETVSAVLPEALPEAVVRWQVTDDQGQIMKEGELTDRTAPLTMGVLPVGWYQILFFDKDHKQLARTTAAVLTKLKAATPLDSPVCVDSATAWFARDDRLKQEYLASLAALAGVNWVRDRLSWHELQPAADTFVDKPTTYDTAADIQHAAGLQVLQVFHSTPAWATDSTLDPENAHSRFPRDLRTIYTFCRYLAERFKGTVGAWEPWNEANVPNFGAQTVDEMCSYQKAAYLGFKAGDSSVIVGWNAYTTSPTHMQADGLAYNQAAAYFDTYNIHSYDWPHSYDHLWPLARQAAQGKPFWITEADRGMQSVTPKPWCDLTFDGEILKAAILPQEYVRSFFAGASYHYHFILGNYSEGSTNGVQFGLLRFDDTPRPAYVALAALGRFLAGGQCLGRLPQKSFAHVYAFHAQPDGVDKLVLVAWAEKDVDWPQRDKTTADWPLPETLKIEQAYDYLGRPLDRHPAELTGKPVYLLLDLDAVKELDLEVPPKPLPVNNAQPSSVIMQARIHQKYTIAYAEKKWAHGYVYQFARTGKYTMPIYIYNFSDKTINGKVTIEEAPVGWQLSESQWNVEIGPNQTQLVTTELSFPEKDIATVNGWIRFVGQFNESQPCALALLIHTTD